MSASHMVYITNTDVPGMIGFIGTTLGAAGVNIANFQLGRDKQGGDAIALLYVDGPVGDDVLDKLTRQPGDPPGKAAGLCGRLCFPPQEIRKPGAGTLRRVFSMFDSRSSLR